MTNSLIRDDIDLDIHRERMRQERRKVQGRFLHTCADPEMNDYECLAVLAEEFGEVAREVLTGEGRRLARDSVGTPEALRAELIQVAAVCKAWVEKLDLPAPTEVGTHPQSVASDAAATPREVN